MSWHQLQKDLQIFIYMVIETYQLYLLSYQFVSISVHDDKDTQILLIMFLFSFIFPFFYLALFNFLLVKTKTDSSSMSNKLYTSNWAQNPIKRVPFLVIKIT